MSVTQSHNTGFSKCPSHKLTTQDFPNVRHTISQPRIFRMSVTQSHNPGIFINAKKKSTKFLQVVGKTLMRLFASTEFLQIVGSFENALRSEPV